MLLSVIMPVYKGEATIARAIESALSFLSEQAELVIVFDGEQDASYHIAETYAKDHRQIRLLYPHVRMGAYYARRVGIAEAKGTYCAFLDADDYFAPDFYSFVEGKLRNGEIDILTFSFYVDKGGKVHKNAFTKNEMTLTAVEGVSALMKDSFIRGFLPSKVLRTELLKGAYSTQGVDALFEDTLVSVIAFSQAKTILYCPKPLYYYVKGTGGANEVSRTKRTTYHLCAFASVRLYLESLDDPRFLEAFYAQKYRSYLSIVYDLSRDRRCGLSREQARPLLKEFSDIFDPKHGLRTQGTSYQRYLPTELSR